MKAKLLEQLNTKLVVYRKSYKLAGYLRWAIYAVQWLIVSSIILLAIPSVALFPHSVIIFLCVPSISMLLGETHRLLRRDRLKASMQFYEYLMLIVRAREVNGQLLSTINDSILLFEHNPLFTEPYKCYTRGSRQKISI